MSVELGGHTPGWRRRGERGSIRVDVRVLLLVVELVGATLTALLLLAASRSFGPAVVVGVGVGGLAGTWLAMLRVARTGALR